MAHDPHVASATDPHDPSPASADAHGHPREEEALDPDEPHTPGWLSLVGGALAITAAITFVATRPPAPTTEQLARAAEAAAEELRAAEAAAAAAKAAAAAPPPQAAPEAPRPAKGG
ncbi:MAG: hypothetical protein IT376_11825 [Polyangiaceae bacterium]|nr:hypothetical protein [Polyangiaceae bacterium]